MPQFAANISMLYPELDFLDRFEAAAKDGFKAVEFLFPYAHEAKELAARLKGNGLQHVLFNMPPGGKDSASFQNAWQQGDRGTACVPGREAEFQAGLKHAIDYALLLGCPRIHTMVGVLPDEVLHERGQATLLANLKWACQTASTHQLELLIEPINPRSIPGFFLNRQDHAHQILALVDEPNLKVQMDLFHCQIVEGDLTTNLESYLLTGRVGHLQIADVPHRHEPGTGEINWPYLFDLIDALSAQCAQPIWVGCEYIPADRRAQGTTRGLVWMNQH